MSHDELAEQSAVYALSIMGLTREVGRLREQLRLATIDAANHEGEANDLREDAARWRHCVAHGFPRINHTGDSRWIAFTPDPVRGENLHFGSSPAEAVDAAIRAIEPK
jgi:hypothetical protein